MPREAKQTTVPLMMDGSKARLYPLSKVAELSGLCKDTIYSYARRGEFPSLKTIGKRQQFINHEDLVNLLGYDPEDNSRTSQSA